LALVFAAALILAGCTKEQPPASAPAATPAKPAEPPPPPPPETSLGTLVKVEKAEKTSLQVLCQGGDEFHAKPGTEVFSIVDRNICNSDDKARAGKVFLILSFEGKAKRRGDGEVTTFRSVTPGEHLARMEERSWLEDAAGTKYRNALLVVKKDAKQVAFEVPADGTGWVWHDGKAAAYKLEPHPVAVAPAAKSAGPGKTAAPGK
jgi:hypothetical protein